MTAPTLQVYSGNLPHPLADFRSLVDRHSTAIYGDPRELALLLRCSETEVEEALSSSVMPRKKPPVRKAAKNPRERSLKLSRAIVRYHSTEPAEQLSWFSWETCGVTVSLCVLAAKKRDSVSQGAPPGC
jgi:hypothetical protein